MAEEFDLVVLGGGSAGYAAARTAQAEGKRVAIVDGGKELGGLCILRGCMPSKTVIYSAEVLHHARNGKRFGLNIPEARPDMKAIKKRKEAMVEDFASYRRESLESERFTLYRDRGQFISPHEIKLESGTRLKAKIFMIATGSAINIPPIPGLRDIDYLTSDDVLDLDTLPESMVVLGGGFIACELAQYLHRMGCKVSQIQRSDHILSDQPEEMATALEHAFRDEGLDLYTSTHIKHIEQNSAGVTVTFNYHGTEKTVTAQKLLAALGRKPASENIGLDKAGVDIADDGKICTNDYLQTCQPHIYAGGDVVGPFEIVHLAVLQGEIAAKHAFGLEAEPINYDHTLIGVFTDPQVAAVGMPEPLMEQRGFEAVSASFPFNDHGKAILMEAHHGYVKVWADRKSGRVLRAECVGKDGCELIHALSIAVAMEATVDDLLKAQWYHPTLSEIWTYPLEDLCEELERPTAGGESRAGEHFGG